ncbi:MAG TPA: type II secretion system F family protein [Nevskiaceae bacterium]|nr:type II secretion system F family protein [Nevskiaceae bacterium]
MHAYSWLISAIVFVAVFMAALALVSYLGGAGRRRLQQRMQQLNQAAPVEEARSLLREQYLRDLTPLERFLEALPGMRNIERLSEQSGRRVPAYRVVLLSLGLAALGALVLLACGRPFLALVAAAVLLPAPYLKLLNDRNNRVTLFEEQLADALDVMSRALKAGNPFNETLKVVAQEMSDPISTEFGITFSDINFGVSVKSALLGLLERVPNISLSAMVTAVLVQRETGGNMAEILERVAQILRQRHRFKRRLRTLTAEGRMSAWVLVLMPFALAVVLSIVSPDYLPRMTQDPFGVQLIIGAVVMMGLGVLWIRRVIRVRY